MAGSGTGYGQYSAQAIDPFPIESVLAKIVGENNPAEAANMLDVYQVQRQTSEGNYNWEMNQQHEFARQQLAQQLYEKNLAATEKALTTPGALEFYNSSPVYQQMLGGANQNVMDRISTNLQASQLADTAQKGGAAAASLTAAGAQPQQAGMDVLSRGTAGPVGLPEAERVANINAAARIAAAKAGAGGGGNSYSIPLPPQPSLGGIAPSMTVRKNQTLQDALERARQEGLQINTPVTPPPSGKTNLPQAKQDTPAPKAAPNAAPTKPTPNTAQGGSEIHSRVEQYVENVVRTKDPAAYADIVAGKKGGRVDLQDDGKGGFFIQGKKNKY